MSETTSLYIVNPEVIAAYEGGKSILELSRECSVSVNRLYRVLKLDGITLTAQEFYLGNPERDAEMAQLYPEFTLREIGVRFGITGERVRQILKRQGIKGVRRSTKERHPAWNSSSEIVDRYRRGEIGKEIARDFNTSATTICLILKSEGVKIRCRPAESRHAEMIRMRRGGAKLREIAEEFNTRTQYVWNIIDRAKKEGTYQTAGATP